MVYLATAHIHMRPFKSTLPDEHELYHFLVLTLKLFYVYETVSFWYTIQLKFSQHENIHTWCIWQTSFFILTLYDKVMENGERAFIITQKQSIRPVLTIPNCLFLVKLFKYHTLFIHIYLPYAWWVLVMFGLFVLHIWFSMNVSNQRSYSVTW